MKLQKKAQRSADGVPRDFIETTFSLGAPQPELGDSNQARSERCIDQVLPLFQLGIQPRISRIPSYRCVTDYPGIDHPESVWSVITSIQI